MASTTDIKSARATYESFIAVVKWTTPALALIAAVVVYLLAA